MSRYDRIEILAYDRLETQRATDVGEAIRESIERKGKDSGATLTDSLMTILIEIVSDLR